MWFDVALKNEKQCIFVAHYQFFREVLFSIEKDGVFVLLSDERSPVFHCSVNGSDNGLMPFLMEFVPEQYKNRIPVDQYSKIGWGNQKISETSGLDL